MALLTSERSIEDFIKISSAGVDIASFTQIRAAIIKRYKQAYGQDIDVSTNNADGVFVNDLSLIINNILKSIQTMYANLDVNTASGVYLENLCRLANVVRKDATHSTAQITIENIGSSAIQIVQSSQSAGTIFVDQAGNEWYYNGSTINLEANQQIEITVEAAETGQVKASAGWINQALNEPFLSVVQENAATVGSIAETDSQLRARRTQSVGAAGTTVLQSLAGELLNINAIRDVKIYNNNQNVSSNSEQSDVTTKDGSILEPHSVYVIIRRDNNVALDEDELNGRASSTIGNIIYQKMTPGISVSSGGDNVTNGVIKEFNVAHDNIVELDQKVYWKQATPIHPNIDINIVAYNTFDLNSMKTKILQTLVEYMNGRQLSNDVNVNDIISEALNADPTAFGRSTYYVTGTNLLTEFITNPDTYFDYSVEASDIVVTQDSTTGNRLMQIQLRG